MNRNRAAVAQTCFGGLRFFPNRQQKAADLQNRFVARLLLTGDHRGVTSYPSMDPLARRLKEMDQNTFQHLCFQLMAEKYPSANIRYVEGASGDEGLDFFCGDLTCGPTIWQCKSFQVSLVGKSQKEQIRKSLRDADQSSSPRLWVLCLNIDFDTKAHRWFQRLKSSYAAKGLTIEHVQGSDIVRELIFRHTLRSHFFPDAQLLDEVRKLIGRSDKFTGNELEMIPGEDVGQYIERLRAKDPRFLYEVTIGGERGPEAFPPPPEPGLVAAITDGRKTIKAYVHDGQALSLDPVGFSITLAGTGIEKMDLLVRTGESQQLDAEEIRDFSTTIPLLSHLGLAPGGFDLSFGSASASRPIPLRLSFVGGDERVIYELLEFYTMRAGTDEVEISTRNDDLPFEIRFVFPTPSMQTTMCKVHIRKQFAGKDVRQVRKAVAAFRLLEAGIEIELYLLRQEKILGRVRLPPFKFDLPHQTIVWLDMLASVSEKFGVCINLPSAGQTSRQEYEFVSLLYALATGGTLSMDQISTTLVKSVENSEMLPDIVRNPRNLALVFPSATFNLFGTEIYRGGYTIYLDKWEFKYTDQILRDFEEAEIGEGVALSIRPLLPVRVFLTSQEALPGKT